MNARRCHRKRIGRRALAGHPVNLDVEEDGNQRIRSAVMSGGHISWFPPHRALLEQPMSPRPLLCAFGSVRKLLIMADDDDAHPLIVSGELIRLDTDAR